MRSAFIGKFITRGSALVVGLALALLVTVAAPPSGAQAQAPPSVQAGAGDGPVTVVVTRFVKRGCEAAFEEAWRQMLPVRAAFPGHLGSDILQPSGPFDSAYHMLFRFDSVSHYRAWERSPERAAWLPRLTALTSGEPRYQYESGLGAWVVLPDQRNKVPEKYKTTAVTWLAIFPLVAGVSAVTGPWTVALPPLARTAIVTGVVVPALSYVIMPPMTWLFRDWLYPPEPACVP